ncbi:MAG: hypothetical protein HY774_16120 [Acidobacteria bacterium]|nr:hypothetical protein [Acidobacteriota bacterium]
MTESPICQEDQPFRQTPVSEARWLSIHDKAPTRDFINFPFQARSIIGSLTKGVF